MCSLNTPGAESMNPFQFLPLEPHARNTFDLQLKYAAIIEFKHTSHILHLLALTFYAFHF